MEFEIKGQVPAQKNSKQVAYNRKTGKPFIMTNQRVKDWQKYASLQIMNIQPITGSVSIEMFFWFKDKRKRDIDNTQTSVMDLLKNNHVIEDDNCFIVPNISAHFCGIDKENPRVKIQIKTIEK